MIPPGTVCRALPLRTVRRRHEAVMTLAADDMEVRHGGIEDPARCAADLSGSQGLGAGGARHLGRNRASTFATTPRTTPHIGGHPALSTWSKRRDVDRLACPRLTRQQRASALQFPTTGSRQAAAKCRQSALTPHGPAPRVNTPKCHAISLPLQCHLLGFMLVPDFSKSTAISPSSHRHSSQPNLGGPQNPDRRRHTR